MNAESYWLGLQQRDGSFPTMVRWSRQHDCAGVASLVITSSELSGMEAQAGEEGVQCCGGGDDRKNHLAAAMRWLAANFRVDKNPGHIGYHFYYLYALERAGRMTGSRFIGKSDWYREGAQQLLMRQTDDGQFRSNSTYEVSPRSIRRLPYCFYPRQATDCYQPLGTWRVPQAN